tara:strand:+ start:1160 stop:1540 length:381 start_codon:yes stop_codon:yes gene_type:complete
MNTTKKTSTPPTPPTPTTPRIVPRNSSPPKIEEERAAAMENRVSSGLKLRRSLFEEKFETPVKAYWEKNQKQPVAVKNVATRKRKRRNDDVTCVKRLFDYPTLLPYYQSGKRRRKGLDQPPTFTRS